MFFSSRLAEPPDAFAVFWPLFPGKLIDHAAVSSYFVYEAIG